ncbi:MAG: DUF4785 family protein [Thermomonas sp.]|uniref:DUF4785 domain-containing protein n=1 Tax=Thermomonas sp. TaxID=1971895 RepID=UPI0026095FB1|nr:DUF4785 domain-containing protein [Thermomonas sp.]MCC7095575.1 DUF4785 family protein [Thermomonas sp.]
MRPQILHAAALAALTTFALPAAQAAQPLLPAAAGDQVPTRLVSLPAPTGMIERKPVSFSWALDPNLSLSQPAPYLSTSREYWLTVDGSELNRGVSLAMSSPGALVRISPARDARALRSSDFTVSTQGRRVAVDRAADAEALRRAGMDASAGTQVLRLGAGSNAGPTILRAQHASGRYVVHVFEPNSDQLLYARPDRDHALAGQPMRVMIGSTANGHRGNLRSSALLVAPDGSSQKVTVRNVAGGGQEAVFNLPSQARQGGGLWELQVFSDISGIPRDIRTAFSVAQPTARFIGSFALDASRLRVSLPVQAASPGRYEARGTLYASAPDGSLRPVSEAHAAAWMNAGNGSLVLQFERAHVPAGYGAPFELRQLELNDQGRMAPIESHARAARF